MPNEPPKIFNEISPWKIKSYGYGNTSYGYKKKKAAQELLLKAVSLCDADLLAVNIKPELAAGNEVFRFGTDDQIAGCRRYYSDTVVPWLTPNKWPDYLFIKKTVLKDVFKSEISLDFTEFIEKAATFGLKIKSLNAGGKKLNIDSSPGFLEFVLHSIEKNAVSPPTCNCNIACDARITGPVVFGENVNIQSGAVIAGPVYIGDNTTVSNNAVVRSSVIASGVNIAPNRCMSAAVL